MAYKGNGRRNERREPNNRSRGNWGTPSYGAGELDENTVIGRNAVKELLSSGRDIEKVYITSGEREGSINQLLGIVSERGIPVFECDKSRLDSLAAGGRHQGIIAIASPHNYASIEDILACASHRNEAPFVIVCDGIEDPHNLGAIIRSAECAGAHGVIIPKRRAVGLTSTVAKASAGAVSHMLVAKVTNLATTLDELKAAGLWVYAADMDGESYCRTDMRGAVALVLGSEGFGISRLVKEKCDFTVSIPLYGKVNSLNVSCAAAVIMTEIARQRNSTEV